MSTISELQQLSAAEEFFQYLDVPYDPATLRVNRLHIMRRLGDLLREEASQADSGDDEAVRERFRTQLCRAYDDLAAEGPMSRRLFKVHKDAVAPQPSLPSNFVPISMLTEPSGSTEG